MKNILFLSILFMSLQAQCQVDTSSIMHRPDGVNNGQQGQIDTASIMRNPAPNSFENNKYQIGSLTKYYKLESIAIGLQVGGIIATGTGIVLMSILNSQTNAKPSYTNGMTTAYTISYVGGGLLMASGFIVHINALMELNKPTTIKPIQ